MSCLNAQSFEDNDNDYDNDYYTYNYPREGDFIVQRNTSGHQQRRRHHTSTISIQQKQLEKQQRIDAAEHKQNIAYITVKTYEKMTAKAKKMLLKAQKEKAEIIRLQRRRIRHSELYNDDAHK